MGYGWLRWVGIAKLGRIDESMDIIAAENAEPQPWKLQIETGMAKAPIIIGWCICEFIPAMVIYAAVLLP